MKEKKTRRWLSLLLLTVVMVLSLLPAAVVPAAAANDSSGYRIVHLDSGRKYFSAANIEKLIDTMAQYGYNQLQLAIGNGGCRFLLDDMGLEFKDASGNDVTMDSDTVKSNITGGNNAFNGDTRYLNQDEMDAIIKYAGRKGIEIVPMLNMPGHAAAIVYGTDYGAGGNLNVNDETARNYGYALLEKYVAYFKDKGCKYFHFGADESGYTGTNMTAFLSGCAEVITGAGMTPRAFNDATDAATMPKDVQITYWHQESGSKTASALAKAGYNLINTHGRWYYVIKPAQNSESGTKYWQGTVNSAATSVELPVMKAEKMDNKWVGINEYFDGNPGSGSTVSDSLGTMFCIWCDASQDTYLTDSDVISENENYGALYQLEKLAEHYWPNDIRKDTAAPVVTVDGGSKVPGKMTKGETLTLTADKSVTWETSDSNVIGLQNSANSATVTGTTVTAVANNPGTATITATDENENKAQHTIEVTAAAADAEQTVTLNVGDSKTFDTTADVGDCETADQYIATAKVTAGETQAAGVKKVTSITSGKKYLITMNDKYVVTNTTVENPSSWTTAVGLKIEKQTISDNNVNALKDYAWTITASGNGYTVVDKDGKYLSINKASDVTLSTASTAETILTLTPSNGKFAFANNGSNIYLDNFGGSSHSSYNTFASAWTQTALQDNILWTLYEITEETSGSNVLTITGAGEGKTSAKIGDVNYTINVTAPTFTEKKALNFGGSFGLPAGAEAEVTDGSDYVTVAGGKVTAGNEAGTAAVTAVVKNAGGKVTARYTYTVTVSDVKFDDVDPLNVQLWITNTWVGEDAAPTALQTVKINAGAAYSEQGVLLQNFVPSIGYKKDGSATVRVTFWKGTALDTAPVENGADMSGKGEDFTRIRYWNHSWQYYYKNSWRDVETAKTIVAYYLQINEVSPEITTGSQHYGNPPTSHPGTTSTNGYALTAFAVVYPDNTLSRTEQEMYETGMVRGFWGSTEFGIGTFLAENNSTYKISKMTVTWGTNIKGISGDGWYTGNQTGTYGTDWGVQWKKKAINDEGDEWYDETAYWKEGDSDIPMIDGDANNLNFNTTDHQAALILIYIEPVAKEENLNIVYWDDSHNARINKNDIQVVVGANTTFLNIQQSSKVQTGTFTLDDDAYIVNSNNVQQRFNKNVTILEEIDERYRSGLYEYDHADISKDGKTLTLHYKVKNLEKYFVFDFGLPMMIDMHKVVSNANELTNVEVIGTPTADNIEYKSDKKAIIYTPEQAISEGDVLHLKLTYGTGTGSTSENVNIGVVPASNVLYEDGFMQIQTQASSTQAAWSGTGSKTGISATSQTADDGSVYGYTDAYNEETGVSGSAYTATVDAAHSITNKLTFTFTGTGLDLIGTCGPDTGTISVNVKNSKGETLKGYVVDTAINDTNVGTIYQVPLLHGQGWTCDTYTVTIMGAYIPHKNSTAATAVFSMNDAAAVSGDDADPTSQVYGLMEAAGISDEDMDDVEFINMDDLYGTAVMTAENGTDAGTSAATPESMKVEIDGFRVYNESHIFDTYYAESERGVTYTNVIKAVLNGDFQAYAENQGDKKWEKLDAYQSSGGPQNEVYLSKGSAIAFKVSDGTATVQISARAVGSDAAQLVVNNGAPVAIKSNTEMYYTVTADSSGVITIRNDGEGMLALGNLKLPGGASTQALTAADEEIVLALLSAESAPVEPEEPETPVFTPEKLNVSVKSVKVIRNKLVTVTVHTSTDVEKLTVNDRVVKPMNALLVKRGWSREYIYVFTDTVKRNDSKDYEVVAYNAAGTASAGKTVTG